MVVFLGDEGSAYSSSSSLVSLGSFPPPDVKSLDPLTGPPPSWQCRLKQVLMLEECGSKWSCLSIQQPTSYKFKATRLEVQLAVTVKVHGKWECWQAGFRNSREDAASSRVFLKPLSHAAAAAAGQFIP